MNGVDFFFAGGTDQYDTLISHYFGEGPALTEYVRTYAFVVDSGKLFSVGISKKDGFWKCPQRLEENHALGSGEDHALTAMDCGLSAKEAVKMAMKRDTNTGGRIRTVKIK